MGIQILDQPHSEADAGIFNLPPKFPRAEKASFWHKEGTQMLKAQEREHLLGTKLTADGWEPWKDPDNKQQIVKRVCSSGTYILCARPREVQDAVNAIYGNVGKERMIAQKRGQPTTGGVEIDPGMLSEEQLAKASGERIPTDDGEVRFNPVTLDKKIEVAPLQT